MPSLQSKRLVTKSSSFVTGNKTYCKKPGGKGGGSENLYGLLLLDLKPVSRLAEINS